MFAKQWSVKRCYTPLYRCAWWPSETRRGGKGRRMFSRERNSTLRGERGGKRTRNRDAGLTADTGEPLRGDPCIGDQGSGRFSSTQSSLLLPKKSPSATAFPGVSPQVVSASCISLSPVSIPGEACMLASIEYDVPTDLTEATQPQTCLPLAPY